MITDENGILLSRPKLASPIDKYLAAVQTEREELSAEYPDRKFILTTNGWVGVSMYFTPENEDGPDQPQPVFLDEPSIGEQDSGLLRVSFVEVRDPESVLASTEFLVTAGQLQTAMADIQWPEGPFYQELHEEVEFVVGTALKSPSADGLDS